MRLLLDTHALLWWQADDSRLGPSARALISDPANDILVSAGSLWEIVVKIRIGKLHADIGAIGRAMMRDGFETLPITPAHLATLTTLPQHHRDPFDHLLIAQAICEDALLLSDDATVPRYAVRTHRCGPHGPSPCGTTAPHAP